jgi:iron-sulfur cluster assembly protein
MEITTNSQTSFKNRKVDYLKLTDNAIAEMLQRLQGKGYLGIKIGLKTKGCSGMAYNIEFATAENTSEFDELVDHAKVQIFIDPKISLFLFGTEMDYVERRNDEGITLESGFVFNNPNEKGRCGCGESFYV